MKILFILGQFPCISETFILNQITGLIDRGHDVRVVALGYHDSTKIHEDYQKYNLESIVSRPSEKFPSAKIKRLFYITRRFVPIWKHFGLKALNLFDVCSYKKLAYTGLLVHAAENICQSGWKPDAVISHFADIGLYVSAYQRCGLLNAPAVVFVHAHEIASKTISEISTKYRVLFNNAQITLLPISYFWYEKLKQSGALPARMKVFRMGVDLEKFNFISPNHHSERNCFNILSVGRLVGQKGYPYSLEAVNLCLKKKLKIQYKIIGEGPMRAEIENFIEKNNIADSVHLLGAKSTQEVISNMQDTDLFLLPSVTDKKGLMEGIPVAIMEAMAMGIPVVSTFHSGIPELIENNTSGWLCQEKDSISIAEKIEMAYQSPQKRQTAAINARKKIEEEYNIDSLMVELENLLADIQKRA